ncbi:MAG TPA: alpha-hydroxy acid oxidase [Paracoccaceae bacterium]|nr:alpha-hydroxy acid oxidase [Paracoccaceae bacterium]
MDDDRNYPGIADLARRARRRVPHFGWEYLESGTGLDQAAARNVAALERVTLWPGILTGRIEPEIAVTLWGETYGRPFGVAPIGTAALIWPGAERALAKAAAEARMPYCLSTVATAGMEIIARHAQGMGWFQLYPPADPDIRDDLLARAKANGYRVLVVTADVPVLSRRERQRKAGVTATLARDPLTYWRILGRPAWALAALRRGAPRFWTLDPYIGGRGGARAAAFISQYFDQVPSWDYLKALRDLWAGPLVLKGVMRPEDAERAVAIGVDGIGVSNHGGRQFDAAPAAIEALPAVKAAVGDRARIIFDSGLRGGLDILRALALGADFCLLGRAFMYGVGALGSRGAAHVAKILTEDLVNNMIQMGVARLDELPGRLAGR